jgi:hypothetical protein
LACQDRGDRQPRGKSGAVVGPEWIWVLVVIVVLVAVVAAALRVVRRR